MLVLLNFEKTPHIFPSWFRETGIKYEFISPVQLQNYWYRSWCDTWGSICHSVTQLFFVFFFDWPEVSHLKFVNWVFSLDYWMVQLFNTFQLHRVRVVCLVGSSLKIFSLDRYGFQFLRVLILGFRIFIRVGFWVWVWLGFDNKPSLSYRRLTEVFHWPNMWLCTRGIFA